MTQEKPPPIQRFVHRDALSLSESLNAAQDYVEKLVPGEYFWLHSKPHDPARAHPAYLTHMFDLLNMLQALNLPAGAHVLEVGAGSGWITEILLQLGYRVTALEPAKNLCEILKARCMRLGSYVRPPLPTVVCRDYDTLSKLNRDGDRFVPGMPDTLSVCELSLEDAPLAPESFDAILFFDALHHVHDETTVIAKCFSSLRPGGMLGIIEAAWHPDFKEQEATLIAEMEKYGTLESPFAAAYLDELLSQAGFLEIQRFVAVNGFFNEQQLGQSLRTTASHSLERSNNVSARKPCELERQYKACRDLETPTDVQVAILAGAIGSGSTDVALRIQISNTGASLLPGSSKQAGHVTIALRQGKFGSAQFRESRNRCPMPEFLAPGQTAQVDAHFILPAGCDSAGWEVDLICEGYYWFSMRDIAGCAVPHLD